MGARGARLSARRRRRHQRMDRGRGLRAVPSGPGHRLSEQPADDRNARRPAARGRNRASSSSCRSRLRHAGLRRRDHRGGRPQHHAVQRLWCRAVRDRAVRHRRHHRLSDESSQRPRRPQHQYPLGRRNRDGRHRPGRGGAGRHRLHHPDRAAGVRLGRPRRHVGPRHRQLDATAAAPPDAGRVRRPAADVRAGSRAAAGDALRDPRNHHGERTAGDGMGLAVADGHDRRSRPPCRSGSAWRIRSAARSWAKASEQCAAASSRPGSRSSG